MKIEKKQWGEYRGEPVWLYTLKSEEMEVDLTNFGCTVTAIRIRGRNVILGYTSLSALLNDSWYIGSIVGRFAGRIANASFAINDVSYDLPANDGSTGHHLHGGDDGLNRYCFKELSQHWGQSEVSITFQAFSSHLHQGYPGELDLTVSIALHNSNQLSFSYLAKPDRPTHINLTHHLYYNLCNDTASSQELMINSEAILQTSDNYIPTGKISPVGPDHDFRSARLIPGSQAFNECYVLKHPGKYNVDARLRDPISGLTMELSTTCPGIVFYTGDFLGAPFNPRQGICLEAQYFPDTPNHKSFPSTLYNQYKSYREQTTLQFKNIS